VTQVRIRNEGPEVLVIVEDELAAYGAGLEDKARLVVLNKLDLADAELIEVFREELLNAGADNVFAVSGATGAGIPELLDAVLAYLPDRTSTETKTVEVENEEDASDWSPL
jgi:GTP-binding protein